MSSRARSGAGVGRPVGSGLCLMDQRAQEIAESTLSGGLALQGHVAQSESLGHTIVLKIRPGEEKDRRIAVVRVAAHTLTDGETLAVRHLQVGDDDMGLERLQALQCLGAVAGGDDSEAQPVEHGGDQVAYGRIVLGNENRGAVSRGHLIHEQRTVVDSSPGEKRGWGQSRAAAW